MDTSLALVHIPGSDFEEDAFAVEEPVWDEADGDEGDGEGEGGVLVLPLKAKRL